MWTVIAHPVVDVPGDLGLIGPPLQSALGLGQPRRSASISQGRQLSRGDDGNLRRPWWFAVSVRTRPEDFYRVLTRIRSGEIPQLPSAVSRGESELRHASPRSIRDSITPSARRSGDCETRAFSSSSIRKRNPKAVMKVATPRAPGRLPRSVSR